MKGAVIYRGEKYFTFLKKIFDSIENVQKNYNFDTYNSLTPNWYYKVLR